MRRWHMRNRYGISPEEKMLLWAYQNGLCAICYNPIPNALNEEGRDMAYVDHDHRCCSGDKSCGKCIRGLLCRSCNAGLGHFRDNVDMLMNAIDYLVESRKKRKK